ncbi:MAG: two pore domain potassium channel family protein [Azospirillum sp.]|nr:two pore domain potassium channel family protein [Azospirillum sp.]
MDHHQPIRPEHTGRLTETRRRQWLRGVIFTALLLSVIALAIKAVLGTLAFVLVGSVVFVVAVFHRVFPGSSFFIIALANFIGAYACLFTVIVESNFQTIAQRDQALGFVLPLLAFCAGACFHSNSFRRIVLSRHLLKESRAVELFLWLLPMAGMTALTFALPSEGISGTPPRFAFLFLMAVTAGIVYLVSRDIATFLVDAGLLFEGFFAQAAKYVLPVFAFLTFYSLLVIGFAAIYSVIDRFSPEPDFIIGGIARPITFFESLYFSIVTISGVGYGDIAPHTGVARLVVSLEIVMGVLLLLFGFSAIIRHSPPDRRRDHHDSQS